MCEAGDRKIAKGHDAPGGGSKGTEGDGSEMVAAARIHGKIIGRNSHNVIICAGSVNI
jgi:hypothetical protein